MNKNQDILKKYFEVKIKQIPANTGLMLLPIRIETRFAENRKVVLRNQPDSVLFIFKELWDMANKGVSIEQMQKILHMMEDLDIVYAQDCHYLNSIIDSIPDSFDKSKQKGNDEELMKLKAEMRAVIDRYANTKRTKPNRATLFVDRVKHLCSRINEVYEARTYSGKLRKAIEQTSSPKIRCTKMQQHVDDTREFLENIYETIDHIPYFSKEQTNRVYNYVKSIRNLAWCTVYKDNQKKVLEYPLIAKAYITNEYPKKPLSQFYDSTLRISAFFDSFDLNKLLGCPVRCTNFSSLF